MEKLEKYRSNIRQLCEQNGIDIIEVELCQNHMYMLVAIPPKYSVASIMGYLKEKSSLIILNRHANLKYKYGNQTILKGLGPEVPVQEPSRLRLNHLFYEWF